MTNLVIGLLSVLLATNAPAAASNLIQQATGAGTNVSATNDPVEALHHEDSRR